MKLKLTELKHPKGAEYLRGRMKPAYVAELVAVAKQAMEKESPAKGLEPERWPFPPIKVTPVYAEPKKTDKKKTRVLRWYEIVDGNHRAAAAEELGMISLDASVETYDDPAEKYLDQLRCQDRGLRLDKDERDAWIKFLCAEPPDGVGLKQSVVAKEMAMSPISISRIVTGKQRKPTGSPRKPAKTPEERVAEKAEKEQITKDAGAKAGRPENQLPFEPAGDAFDGKAWIERVIWVTSSFHKHRSAAITFLGGSTVNRGPKFQEFVSQLVDLVQAVTALADPAKQTPAEKEIKKPAGTETGLAPRGEGGNHV